MHSYSQEISSYNQTMTFLSFNSFYMNWRFILTWILHSLGRFIVYHMFHTTTTDGRTDDDDGRTDGRRTTTTDGRRSKRRTDDDGRRRRRRRTTTDDDGRRRTVSVFQLFTPQDLVVQKRYLFFRNPLDEIYLPRWFPSL